MPNNRTCLCWYVGSTKKTLEDWLEIHKSFKRIWERGSRHYLTAYQIIESNDCYTELIEVYDEKDRRLRGKFYIRSMNCVNKRREVRKQKEYEQTQVYIFFILYKNNRNNTRKFSTKKSVKNTIKNTMKLKNI